MLNRSTDGKIYDNFRHRLIFPIFSLRQKTVGFGARALDDSIPKYINSKESRIFHKGDILYGLNKSSRYIRNRSPVLLVEGYTDFLSLWKFGFKNIAATLGTALTSNHARLLKKHTDSVILIFDGDEAGIKAGERSLPILLSESLEVQILSLPLNQDPDDLIRSQGKEIFQDRIKNVKDMFFFILQKKYKEFKNSGQPTGFFISQIKPLLDSVQNKNLKMIYKQRILDLFGSDSVFIEKILDKKPEKIKFDSRKEVKYDDKTPKTQGFSIAQALESERFLLVLCLDSESLLNEFINKNDISVINTPGIFWLFKKIEEHYRQKQVDFDNLVHLILDDISDKSLIFKASYPIFRNIGPEDEKKIFQDCLNVLRKKKQYSTASELVAEIKMDYKEDAHRLEKVFQLTKQRLQKGVKPKT